MRFFASLFVAVIILLTATSGRGGEWTCIPEGRSCTFGSDCCSGNCVNDPKLGSVCKPKGASWTCIPRGQGCTFGSDCCSQKCVNDPTLGSVCK